MKTMIEINNIFSCLLYFLQAEMETPTSALRPLAPYLQGEATTPYSQQQQSSRNNQQGNNEIPWFQPKVKKSKHHHST